MLFVFLILAAIVLGQPSPPALGVQIGYPRDGYDIRFPLTVTQCESVFIFYNFTSRDPQSLHFIQPDYNIFLDIGPFSPEDITGVGYIEWICNIPADYAFWAGFSGYLRTPVYVVHPVVVQPGSLSSCLHNVTATYQYAVYYPSNLFSYTARPLATTYSISSIFFAMYAFVPGFLGVTLIPTSSRSTVTFPTGSFSTLTIKYATTHSPSQ